MSSWCRVIDDSNDLLHVCKSCHKCNKCHECSKSKTFKHNKLHCKYQSEIHVDKLHVNKICGLIQNENKCHTIINKHSYAQFIYYDTFTVQTIASGASVKFNINGHKSDDIKHNDSLNNDIIVLDKCGIYKVDFVLTLDPQSDTSAPPDDHVFALIINNVLYPPSKFGNGQHNSIAPYQINGSAIIDVPDESTIKLVNVGATAVTLVKSLDTTTVVGASVTITRIN